MNLKHLFILKIYTNLKICAIFICVKCIDLNGNCKATFSKLCWWDFNFHFKICLYSGMGLASTFCTDLLKVKIHCTFLLESLFPSSFQNSVSHLSVCLSRNGSIWIIHYASRILYLPLLHWYSSKIQKLFQKYELSFCYLEFSEEQHQGQYV